MQDQQYAFSSQCCSWARSHHECH